MSRLITTQMRCCWIVTQKDAREGGNVAGRTRRDIEKRSGKAVVTSENYKELADKGQKKLRK